MNVYLSPAESLCPCILNATVAAGESQAVMLAVADTEQREMMLNCLVGEGLEVLQASLGGDDLFSQCSQHRPWLLIADLECMASHYDSFHSCRQRACHPLTLLLAPLDEPKRTASFLTLAADDMLPSPCPEALFRLRLNLLLRFRQAPSLRSSGTVASQRAPNIRHLFHAASSHGSEVFLVGQGAKRGHQIVFTGDLNGCGRAATRTVLCLAQHFTDALRRYDEVAEVVRYIHYGLLENLPGISVPASVMALDPAHKRLKLWNGGLPDVLAWRHGGQTLQPLPSHSPALGAVRRGLDKSLHELPLHAEDRLYCYTESLHAIRMDTEWLKTRLANTPAAERFHHIHAELDNRLAETAPGQDISFAEIAPYDRRRQSRD